MKKHCPICGVAFSGRRDKRFCSDACRNAHHNTLNSDATNFVRNINNLLRRNRRILTKLNTTGKTKLHKDKLLEQGFNFNYFTNIYTTKAGRVYHFVYDQGYIALEDGYYALVVKQEYVA
ncbi:MAG: DUF2116 family Zn-ribbon domain-containing protein [Saprospiraceae bacterium]|nr:DUF2116 family Zn-ribbon domain-containing protein [Saprospiraceae bacterium]